MKSFYLLLTTSVALANCGLLGHIHYAKNQLHQHLQHHHHQDATKVSYNSVAQPFLAGAAVGGYHYNNPYQEAQQLQYQYVQQEQPQQQQQLVYQTGFAAEYPHQANYVQSAPLVQQQSYASPAPIASYYQPQQYYSPAADVSYSYVAGPTTSYSHGNLHHPVEQSIAPPHPVTLPVSLSVQPQPQPQPHYPSVQPLTQPIVQIQPPKPQPKPVEQGYLPAPKPQPVPLPQPLPQPRPLPTVTQGYLPAQVNVKNAHHYPAFVNNHQAQHQQQQQQIVSSYKTPVFRTSFSASQSESIKASVAPLTVIGQQTSTATASGHRVIESGPHFTHTIISSGHGPSVASSSSSQHSHGLLQSNPIQVPSAALVGPATIQQQTTTTVQQQEQHHHQQVRHYSPSTAVSHATFEGLGVKYQW